jgi:acyl-CoA thioesterase-1
LRSFHILAFAIATLVLTPAASGAQPVKLVALGDSLTAGYQLPADAALPAVLERNLKAAGLDVEVSNAGVSGDTAAGGLERLDWAVGEGVDGVILALGANDMLRGLDPVATEKALGQIIQRVQDRGMRVLLVGMRATPSMGPEYVARFDAIYARLAERHGVSLYPFMLDGVVQDLKLNLADGLHPNRAGVEKIAKAMQPAVVAFVDQIRTARRNR